MPFQPIVAASLTDGAAQQIRQLIAEDVLRPGDMLPGERDLAQRMGISRTSLREALQKLVSEGLLVSRQGAGLRVSDNLGRALTEPVARLIDATGKGEIDYLQFRRMFEGECAAVAAEMATPQERSEIERIHRRIEEAHTSGDREMEASLDTEFHMAIVEATGNVVTIQLARSLHEILRSGIIRHHQLVYGSDGQSHTLLDQHAAINQAIQQQDASAAREAMHAHLDYLESVVARMQDHAAREEIVTKRRKWSRETIG